MIWLRKIDIPTTIQQPLLYLALFSFQQEHPCSLQDQVQQSPSPNLCRKSHHRQIQHRIPLPIISNLCAYNRDAPLCIRSKAVREYSVNANNDPIFELYVLPSVNREAS